MTAVTALEIVLTAACLSCLAGVWHYYDVAKQARIDRAFWYGHYDSLSVKHAALTRERDEWKRKHEALVLVVKIRGSALRR